MWYILTCSTTGAFRLPRDVLSRDRLIFLSNLRLMMIRMRHIERLLRGMEGIIRQMRKSPLTTCRRHLLRESKNAR